MGQVRATLDESDHERWEAVVELLDRAETAAVRREFEASREYLGKAIQLIG
jgi:hypothetical protein